MSSSFISSFSTDFSSFPSSICLSGKRYLRWSSSVRLKLVSSEVRFSPPLSLGQFLSKCLLPGHNGHFAVFFLAFLAGLGFTSTP